jgi:DNA-binding MarR family transcriptional regulator
MTETGAPPDGPLLAACRELARAMDEFDEAACGALGLGRSDLRALNLLEHGPSTPSELARRLGLTRPAVTALIDRLATAGYVTRTSVPHDRRGSAVELTPHTWHALARVYRPLGQQIQQVDGHLGDAERRALVNGLAHLTATFDGTRSLLADRPESGRPSD